MRPSLLDRYILRSHVAPYVFGVAVITFIFVMDFIFRSLDMFIGKGVDILVVLEFFVLSLGHMYALIIPMAVMPATLMAFGQLAAENEVTAMKASGVSLYRMIAPVLFASVLLGGFLVYYNNAILPESNHRLMNLMIAIGKMRPTLEIKENLFSDGIEGYTIYVREKDDRTGEIRDVLITEKKKGASPTTIVAARGRMEYLDDRNVLRFELEDGEIHEMPDAGDITSYRRTSFRNFTLNIQDADRSLRRTERSHRGDREMSAGMMRRRIEEIEEDIAAVETKMHRFASREILGKAALVFPEFAGPADEAAEPVEDGRTPPATPRTRTISDPAGQTLGFLETQTHIIESNRNQISRYGVEIHKKYSIPFSCIVFVLLGAPLAIRAGKKGMTMSVGFSILFFLVYYMFLISGEKLADRRYLDPWLAMWMPNFVLSAAAAFLLHSTVREAQTINWERLDVLKRWRKRTR
ncbi:MAG: LptF/LptG family permease [Candidatus Krumholzibacteriota bacterium]|nr:LptF/LptG family permease [Candidatus Krumholzibacteriota bacterium]